MKSGPSSHHHLDLMPRKADLEKAFFAKYGRPEQMGWGPKMRYSFGYFSPDEFYEATLDRLTNNSTLWLDIGCGSSILPTNPALALKLANRCRLLVGVDPDKSIRTNPYLHQRVEAAVETYKADVQFDLVTLRMVIEHFQKPEELCQLLTKLTKPGSMLLIYTPHKWALTSIVSRMLPFWTHEHIKKKLWHSKEGETFRAFYRMNTRQDLKKIANSSGFKELAYFYLDDCRTFHRMRGLHYIELALWSLLHNIGVHYMDFCLLGLYERI